MMLTKKGVLKKLKKLGWEYVIDEYTDSKFGHRREHFQKLNVFEYNLAEIDYVLIFHYLDKEENKEERCHIQTHRLFGDYQDVIGHYKQNNYDFSISKGSVFLSTEEMILFMKLMKLIDKENGYEN